MFAYVHICTIANMYKLICVYVHVCMYVCMYVYIYIYIYTSVSPPLYSDGVKWTWSD